jgi:16S rRNA (guanine527-N7)-methyltransferase
MEFSHSSALENNNQVKNLREWGEEVGISIGRKEKERILAYLEELVDYNWRINLVAKASEEEILRKHFIDSLACYSLLPKEHYLHLLDIGTGAGFPGIVLKIVRPDIIVHLLEASRRKCFFLGHIVSLLKFDGIKILNGRAEDFGQSDGYARGYDVVVCRAVAHLSVIFEYAFPLLRLGGLFIAQKGPSGMNELEEVKGVLKVLGGKLKETKEFVLPGGREKRIIFVFRKERETSSKYPRKRGIPAKKPLHTLNVPRGTKHKRKINS